jgi:acyl-CoA hydrolase
VSEPSSTPSSTRVEMNQIVMPGQANALGTVFGGQIMAWIDVCAAIAAQRFARGPVVTASMDNLLFRAPIKQGHVVILQAMVNWAGRTSMEVGVRVDSEDPRTGTRTHTSTCYLTFVALDDLGQPKPVPALVIVSDDDRRRHGDAERRRARRLAARDEDQRRRSP